MGAEFGPGPPSAGREMLARRRLLERLERRWRVPVTVVCAPAGYGKTTLLAQAIEANSTTRSGLDCWVTCGSELAAASAFSEALCSALDAPNRPPAQADLNELADAVVNAMWRHSTKHVALLIDDVHEMGEDSDAAQLLTLVVTKLPANGHVVIAGRVDPALPPRLEVARSVLHLDQSDLTFTEAELTEFASLRGVPNAQVEASAGWPAHAELLATRPKASASYVGQEVLSHLPTEHRRVLAQLAHLDSFDDEVATAVIGSDLNVAELVAGVPLVNELADEQWSIHSLLQDGLADAVTECDIAEARRRAGLVRLGQGRTVNAVRSLIDAAAWDDVGQAIATALGAAHPPVARDVLEYWLTQLPDAVRKRPAGQLLSAVLVTESDPEQAWQMFEECAQAFRSNKQIDGELACLVQLGQLAWWSERPERLAAVAGRAFELEAAGHQDAVPFACLGRALIADINCDTQQQLRELERIPPGSLNDAWQGIVIWAKAIAYLQLGYAERAEEEAEQALAMAGSMHAPLAETTRLQAMWHQGKIKEVTEALPTFVQRIKESGYRSQAALIHAHCSLVHALQGHQHEATQHLDNAHAAATVVADAPLLDTIITLAETAAAITQGDEDEAAAKIDQYLERYPTDQGLPAAAHRRNLALLYCLAPQTRPVWDKADLGPTFRVGRDLARAMTAVREHHQLPPDTPRLDDGGMVQAYLPARWIADLALAAIAAGRDDGWTLIRQTWPATHRRVQEHVAQQDDRLAEAATAVLAEIAVPPTSRLQLRLLGPIELCRDGEVVKADGWSRQRVRVLLAHLALHTICSREQTAANLWPDASSDRQVGNLGVTLTYLRPVLEPNHRQGGPSFFIQQDSKNLSLNTGEWLTVDVNDFDHHCDQAEQAYQQGLPQAAIDHARQAIDLWQGEPEVANELWAVAHIEERKIRYAKVAIRAGELLLAQRNTDDAEGLAKKALAMDPVCEPAHLLLIASHTQAGNYIAARQAINRYGGILLERRVPAERVDHLIQELLNSLRPADE